MRTFVLFVDVAGGGQVILGTIKFSVSNQVILDAVCSFGCTVRLPSIILSRPFFPGLAPQVRDTASFDPTLSGPNDKVFTNDRWEYFFTNPAAAPPSTETAMIWSGPHRCDSTLENLNPGCAYSTELPIHTVTGGPNDKYVRHIQLSINYGLPDFLTRTTDKNKRDANRDIACPSSIPRGGLDCDEYPFASTTQGAASFGPSGRKQFLIVNLNNPNVGFFCGIPPQLAPQRQPGDSSGFSVCLIPKTDNERGGGFLSNFYYDNRVIDGDVFRVIVR